MRFDSLAAWLAWQEGLHPSTIDLGLERVCEVHQRLGGAAPAPVVITVAGTNGKGSSCAMLEAIYGAAGFRTGRYSSPHLLRYNERVVINGAEVSDQALCEAFERVDQARGEASLTYFEFGTLAALDVFQRAALDVVILEVGMGGRLDAVNIVDPDVALITNVGLDHQEWLGNDRETIGFEKAGIMRAGRPVVYGETDVPESVRRHAEQLAVEMKCFGRDFGIRSRTAQGWTWWGDSQQRDALPWPALRATVQLQNAAGVLMVVDLLRDRLPVTQDQIRNGLLAATVPGRLQVLPGEPVRILDVAHNPESAEVLAASLAAMPVPGRTLAVVGMLRDKDLAGTLAKLAHSVDGWYLAGLGGARGASAAQLAEALSGVGHGSAAQCFETVAQAYGAARSAMKTGDRLVVFGSFYTVAEALSYGP